MKFKTAPFEHQRVEFESTKDFESWCIFWEQGTGKTWAGINTIAHLWYDGKINGVVVIAPSGVHLNWIRDELPKHLPDDIPLMAYAYKTGMTKTQRQTLMSLIDGHKGLSFLAMTYDSAVTNDGKKVLDYMAQRRRCIRILDESARVKSPNAKRTRTLALDTKFFPYKRILSGTPVSQGPFDIYSQVRMVDPDFWTREIGVKTAAGFRSRYGVYENGPYDPSLKVRDASGKVVQVGGCIQLLAGYQKLEELNHLLKKISSRVTKAEVLDLPPKLYVARYYQLTPKQRRVYEELERDCVAILDGETVTADLAIVQLLRMQQVLCGYVPVDGDEEPRELIPGDENPRLDALMEAVEDYPGKAIVWATWDKDIDLILNRLRKSGAVPVQYDGRVSEEDRDKAKRLFINGEATHFVGKPSVGGEGLTLLCNQVFYYNNSYVLTQRLQSEDRAHRIGQINPVTYVDLICPGTKDESAIRNLTDKLKTSQTILGDKQIEWLKCLIRTQS